MMVEFKGPLLIVGSGRSGTSMLVQILNVNKEINIITGEPFFLDYVYGYRKTTGKFGEDKCKDHLQKYLNNRKRSKKSWSNVNLEKWINSTKNENNDYSLLYIKLMEQFTPKNDDINLCETYIGAKNPHDTIHLQLLNKMFPNSRFINVIRDGRSVVASMINGYVGPDNIIEAALLWKAYVHYADKYNGNNILNVYYEKLLLNSDETIKQVCSFLDIPYDENMIRNFTSENSSFSKTRVKGIDKSRINRFEQGLTEDQLFIVEYILKEELINHGYLTQDHDFKKICYKVKVQVFIKSKILGIKLFIKQNVIRFGIKAIFKRSIL